ncbi:hypothetical protein BB558_001096 [Smittium angustum]|uniref:AAA+ ATPase domain-containing protein n=1 Tax=Smittium angustum TaxID=133377 RepID=A0A2U1JCM2_SMIAN|nr:hypothetical protein BB558_003744 [Smittium angustum]PWA02759.1 hypothetical protein BB558_001096 [Smittium angustum]
MFIYHSSLKDLKRLRILSFVTSKIHKKPLGLNFPVRNKSSSAFPKNSPFPHCQAPLPEKPLTKKCLQDLTLRPLSTCLPNQRWGSHPGIHSGYNNYNSKPQTKNPTNNIYDGLENNKHNDHFADSSSISPSANYNAHYRKIIANGNQNLIRQEVLNHIESFDQYADIETIELYLQGLLLTNETPQAAASKLVHVLRRYPLLASSLKISQLINSNFLSGFYKNIENQLGSNYSDPQTNSFQHDPRNIIQSRLSKDQSNHLNNGNKRESSAETPDNLLASNNEDSQDHGSTVKPIHVVVTEERRSMIIKTFRWLVGTLVYAFCILTFLNLALEGSGVMKASQSPKEFVPEENTKVNFSDVQGCEEAKAELQELVDFLKDPKEFSQLGGKLPRGVLLTGPPGTGKTLLARAVAGEAGVPFYFMSGAEFDEIYVGVGSKRLRELFAAARQKSPSIVFIDEIDAIGSKRSQRDQSYMKQTLNQLLVELDGFTQSEGVIFIAATNFPESLDSALTRPGRFDRVVDVPLPDVRGRMAILRLHTKKIPLSKDVDLSVIARGTVGFSGAELNNLVNIAAIQASKSKADVVTTTDLEYAKDRILMGAERKSAFITLESRKSTAYHEGGHALAALYTSGALPLHKATIIPRGHALGVTVQLPELDRNSFTRQEYLAMLDVCMGGYVAEHLIFGYDNVTSGSSNDLEKATSLATSMVTEYGMSDRIGHVAYAKSNYDKLSAETKRLIDEEIRRLSEDSYQRVLKLLTEKRSELDALADALVEYETLDQSEIQDIVKGVPLKRKSVNVL